MFDVDVSNVEPNIAEVGRGFAYLGKYDSCVTNVAFVCQHSTDAIGSPDVFGVISNNLEKKTSTCIFETDIQTFFLDPAL